MSRIILWLRNDLRMVDNYAMNWAIQYAKPKKEIIPVYCFDPRTFKNHTDYETRKTGLVRARFQIESVLDLRQSLKQVGSELVLSCEKPETFLPKLFSKDMENIIVYQTEICSEELEVEDNVKYHAKKTGLETKVQSVWGSTIVHIDDMPYDPVDFIPANFSGMRNKTRDSEVRGILNVPKKGQMSFP